MEGLFVYAAGMPNIWKKVRLEVLGPFSKTAAGNRFLVFAVDPFTYWTEAIALPQDDPDQIARFVMFLFARFGRTEVSLVGQKSEFCRTLAVSLEELWKQQDVVFGIGKEKSDSPGITHSRHGVEQVYNLADLGFEAGVTTGGMALNEDGEVICNVDHLPPAQAALFAQSDPVNPIPQHMAFNRVARYLKQRSINYTNLGSDLLSFVSANRADWDMKLDGCLYHLRTAVRVCNKGYSAHHLIYGRNPCPITGRELMVRSLTGIKEVLAFFSVNGVGKRVRCSRKKCASDDDEKSCEDEDLIVQPRSCATALGTHLETAEARNQTRPYNLRANTKSRDCLTNQKRIVLKKHVSIPRSTVDTDTAQTGNGELIPEISEIVILSTSNILSEKLPAFGGATALLACGKTESCTVLTVQTTGSSIETLANKSISTATKKLNLSGTTSLSAKPGSRRRKRADVLKVKCPDCPNTYVTCQEELELHLQCHGIDEDTQDRIFKCPDCGKICKIWLNMVRHMGHHRDISTFRKLPDECYKCKYCFKDFKVPECLREHVSVVHEGKKRFECHICHEKFKVYKTKMRHMDIKHANITYTCELCPYTTKVRRNLKQHTENHQKKLRKEREDEVLASRIDGQGVEPLIGLLAGEGNQLPLNLLQSSTSDSTTVSLQQDGVGMSQLGLFHRMQSASAAANLSKVSQTAQGRSKNLAGGANEQQPSQIFYFSPTGTLVSSAAAQPLSGMQLQPGMFTLQFPSSSGNFLNGVPFNFADGNAQIVQNVGVNFVEEFVPSGSFS